jgi:hypothetical protein
LRQEKKAITNVDTVKNKKLFFFFSFRSFSFFFMLDERVKNRSFLTLLQKALQKKKTGEMGDVLKSN